jgi:ribosomal protein S12 methylthiotransferase accessory factor
MTMTASRYTATESANVKAHLEFTHRTRTPDQAWAAFHPMATAMGITRVANMTGLDWIGIPVYNAIRPNSRSLSVSQGKGATHAAARMSAFMESAEYWHAEFQRCPLRHESYQQLGRESAVIDVTGLPRRAGLDSFGAGARETPARATFHPDLPHLWLEAKELHRGGPIWVPYDTVRLNKVGMDYAETTFRVASNGLASGNTLAEATVHGLSELIERDALTLWWQSQRTSSHHYQTLLDLDSVTDPTCRGLIEAYQSAGLQVAVWDVTSDIDIPTYQSCVVERDDRAVWRPFGPCWGYGAHPAPEVALSRALTEAAQSRITVIAASRDDNFPSQYRAQNDSRRMAAVRKAFFARPGTVDFAARPSVATPTVDGDLTVILGRLERAGIDTVAAVDLTQPELGIPVVKVVVPGLEYFSLFIGYSPGRRARREEAPPISPAEPEVAACES